MIDTAVVGRYARALLIVTEKRGETAQALPDLMAVRDAIAPGTRAGRLFATPEVPLAAKRQALDRAFGGRALRTVVVFVDLLLRKKRLRELDAITHEFEALVERAQGIQRAHVTSAVPLPPAEQARLLKELERLTGHTIRLSSEVDPALIGGALVRIGDRVIDRSVRTLLKRLAHRLQETSV
jgi:F-type H+-transporting ATPase subunit delta